MNSFKVFCQIVTITFKIIVILAWVAIPTRGQPNAFRNLDFDDIRLPVVPEDYGGVVSTASVLPGWTAYIGDTATEIIGHNRETTGSASISIIGPHAKAFQLQNMVNMQTGAVMPNLNQHPVAISQAGIIPPNSRSMRYFASVVRDTALEVRFNNRVLFPELLAVNNGYSEYGVDVSLLAGESGELRFTAVALPDRSGSVVRLDGIWFSLSPIPEPGVLSLLLCGFGLFAWWRKLPSGR